MEDNNLNNIPIDEVKKNVRLKNIKFKEERKNVLNTILEILNINDNNKIFYSHMLDEDENLQNQILALDQEIERVFKVSSWIAYKQKETIERRYLALVKSIFKEMNVKYESASIRKKHKDKTIYTTMYTVLTIE
jgi:hypothetical protein